MLQDLRAQKNNWLIVLLFGIIIIVFIFMFGMPGADSVASRAQDDVASVGSHDIGYDLMRSMIYKNYDDNVFSSMQYPAVARQVTEGIAVIYLLADEARAAGLRVSDEELQDYLTNWESGNPDILRLGFLHQNKFSQRSYNDALARLSISAKDYENYKREELLAVRYMTLMASSITVSDESLWADYAIANATATLEVVRLTNAQVGATFKPITPAEISAFETSNAADIQKYYDEHLGDYTTPPKMKLHQIVIQKDFSKLTNPGAKTTKTFQPAERFAIARTEIFDKKSDFAQAYTNYDESEDKSLQGMTGLLDVGIMAEELQTALAGKKVDEIITAELSDRFIIAKVVDQTEKIVKPLDEVKASIAQKLLEEQRIKNKTEEVATNLIAQAQAGKSLAESLNATLYLNVLAEQPMAPAAPAAPADGTQPDAAAPADGTQPDAAAVAAAPVMIPVPTDLPIVAESSRVKVATVSDITINTGFLMGIGVNDDLARDVRNAAAGTILAKAYTIGMDTVIVRVVSKKDANRELFETEKEALRTAAIQQKTLQLVGDVEALRTLSGSYGLWIQQKLAEAKPTGKLTINEDYFKRETERRVKAAQEQ